MTLKTTSLAAVGALTLALASTGAAFAAPMQVSANLTSSAEVPPNNSDAKGELTGTYDPSTKKLDFTVKFSDLSGPPTMAHLHAPAPTGKNAGIEVPIVGELKSPITRNVTLSDEQAKSLTDGMTYINIHTAKNTGGEIRGQIMTH